MLSQLAHKIRLYPNKEAEIYLKKSCGVARFSYNWALGKWNELHKNGEKPYIGSLAKEFNSIKRDQFPWSQEVSKCVPARAMIDLGDAFQKFFKKEVRHPKFKKKGKSHDSFYLGDRYFKVSGKYLKLPKFEKPIKMAQTLRFEGRILFCVISRDKVGDWYASFNVELSEDFIYSHSCENQAVVGVDIGLKTLAVCSDGTKFENLRAFKKAEKKIRKRNKSLHRKVFGSNNRNKARIILAKAYRKASRVRIEAWRQVTSWLVKNFRFIGAEHLNIAGMVKNKRLAKALHDAALYEFRRQLAYKTKLSGSHLVLADQFFPSSKLCSNCGFKLDRLTLLIREWDCPSCHSHHDRDFNASKNLENVAAGYAETLNACGADVRPEPVRRRRFAKKQECSV
jgi:putative transposase